MNTQWTERKTRSIAWITVILLLHLIVFTLRSNAVLAAPNPSIQVDNLTDDQLLDRAAAAVVLARKGHDNKYQAPNNHQGKWVEAEVYLAAFLGRLSATGEHSQEIRTYQANLDEIHTYVNDLMAAGTEYKLHQVIITSCLKEAGVPNSYSRQSNLRAPSLLPARAPAPSSNQPRAPAALFNEDFSGPRLNGVFVEGLPDSVFRPNSSNRASYEGTPFYAFQSWSGDDFLRLYNRLGDAQRRGWHTSDSYNPGNRAFRLEVRFNPFTQSREKGIDQLLEVWLIDPNDIHEHIRVTVFSSGYGAERMFAYTNTLINKGEERKFDFQDNVWYRLVITGSPNQTIKAAVYDDAGTKELVSLLVGSNLSAFPKGFRLGLSQSVGFPGGTYPTDVGIDWIRLTAVNQ